MGQAEWSGVAGGGGGEALCCLMVPPHRYPPGSCLGSFLRVQPAASELGCPRPLGTAMSQTLALGQCEASAFVLPTRPRSSVLFLGLAAWLVLTASGRLRARPPGPAAPTPNPFCFHSRAPARACHLPPPPTPCPTTSTSMPLCPHGSPRLILQSLSLPSAPFICNHTLAPGTCANTPRPLRSACSKNRATEQAFSERLEASPTDPPQ